MERLASDEEAQNCPGQCNVYRNQNSGLPNTSDAPFNQTIFNRNIYNTNEYAFFCKKTQTDDDLIRPISAALSFEERKFIEELRKRLQKRKRGQFISRQYLLQRFIAFMIFLFLHSILAIFTKNYQQYQTFLATQFCGFITIMFWDNE